MVKHTQTIRRFLPTNRFSVFYHFVGLSLKKLILSCTMLKNEQTMDIFSTILRSSRPNLFCEKGVLRTFANFTGKHLRQTVFFNKVAGNACNFIQKETLAQVFSCEVCEISKNTFFYRTTLVVASAYFKNLKFINGILSRYYKIEKNKITHLKLSTKMYRKTSSYVQIDKIMLYRDFIWKQSNKKRISKLFRMQKPLELCHKLRLIFIATL